MVVLGKPGIEFTSGKSGRSLVVVYERAEDEYLTSGSSVICTAAVDVEKSREIETREIGDYCGLLWKCSRQRCQNQAHKPDIGANGRVHIVAPQ